jgi:D-aspartate ligase
VIPNTKLNPGAFIIDGRGRADLGLVRALGERGVPVYLATEDPYSPVALSRYVTKVFPMPPAQWPEEARVAALMDIGAQFRHQPVFFSSGDTSLVLFSRYRERLEPYFRHHLSEQSLVEAVYDKMRFAVLAQERRLDVPFTLVPRSVAQLESALHQFKYPVMVKPAEKNTWRASAELTALTKGDTKGLRLETPEALLAFYRAASRFDSRMVIQDYIAGRDEQIYSMHAYVDRDGDLLGAFIGQKLRTYPVHRGIGCFQRSVYEPKVLEVGTKALLALGYTGHAVLNLKRLPDEDRFVIFEINGRYSTWNYLHTFAGVNLPYAAYRDSLGEKQRPLDRQQEGCRWVDFRNDLRAFRQYRRLGEWSTLSWIRSYFGRNCYAVFAKNDPLPLLVRPARWLARVTMYPLRAVLRLTAVRAQRS